jgi:hypothetical protein
MAFCDRAKTQAKMKKQNLLPFERLCQLKALRGIQIESKWIVAYGPRIFGRFALSGQILEHSCPDVAFTLAPKGQEAVFKTKYPDQVKLNGTAIDSDTLKSGDLITIGDTLIEFSYLE